MPYPKIQTLFKRTKKGELVVGDWTDPTFEYLVSNLWRCTEKIDGTNIRIIIGSEAANIFTPNRQVVFCGRTDTAQLPAKLVAWLQEKFLSEAMLSTMKEKFPDGATLYGEGFGAGIQKGGGNYQDFQSFILFDVRVGDWWLRHGDVVDVAISLKLDMVPVVAETTLHEVIELVQKGLKSRFGDFPAEGVVAEPVVPLFNRKGDRVITKIKTRDFQRAVEKG